MTITDKLIDLLRDGVKGDKIIISGNIKSVSAMASSLRKKYGNGKGLRVKQWAENIKVEVI